MSQWLKTSTRWAIYLRDDMACVYCGVTIPQLISARETNFLTIDHLKPKSKGGDNSARNLLACCYECNVAKRAMSMRAFCADFELSYEAVRARSWTRRRRDVERYRHAAKIITGTVDGFEAASLVTNHDWLVKRQWDTVAVAGQWWDFQQAERIPF